jgi:hypothetical protein
MSVEDRVRTATRARAGLVRDIRPLDLPAAKAVRLARAPRARGWSAWMAPVTAAAVVVALAITLVSLREVRNEPSVSPAATAASGSGATSAAGVPPQYYAALDGPSGTAFNDQNAAHVVDVVVGDSNSPQPVATVTPPHGQTFAGLTAAADDRTFVVAAESFPVPDGGYTTAPVAWYLLRIAPGATKAATLTKLSIPGQPPGTQVSGIALSPDGSELAVLFQRGVWVIGGRAGPLTLSVYSVSTGKALRTWTQQTNDRPAGYGWYWGRYSNSSVTWLSDGRTLAFADGTLSGDNGPPMGGAFSGVKIRAINLAGPSGDLIAESKVVFSSKNHSCSTLQLTPDGKTVFCGTYGSNGGKSSSANDPEILAYSVATGKSRLVYRLKGAFTYGLANVLWLSPDGSTLIGAVFAPGGESRPGVTGDEQAVGLITKGTLRPLRSPQSGVPLAGEIAF